jgi:arsenate reductase
MKTNILFVCSHNTTRSQIAQGLLEKYGGEDFLVMSAGIEAGELNPMAVEIMNDNEEYDIASYTTNKIIDYYKEGLHFHYVVTVCDEAKKEPCPVFPSLDGVLHWNISSPACDGSYEEKKAKVQKSYEESKENVLKLVELVQNEHIKSGFPEEWHVNE